MPFPMHHKQKVINYPRGISNVASVASDQISFSVHSSDDFQHCETGKLLGTAFLLFEITMGQLRNCCILC
ncbi:hypothetical protein RRG08_049027 [Elysia crispata]|uniref:Uncharacterized protein n=1 Tax=Elysia crispata TaxID=231223 RepID=A0AAE0ZSX0_9GAST|nr:hypothetical protein RRG08_049027 [Elysia crispata]